MPLTAKGEKIRAAMHEQYGAKKGESVFYASINKGNIKGAEKEGERSNPSTHTPRNFIGHPMASVGHHQSVGRTLKSAADPGGKTAPGVDRS